MTETIDAKKKDLAVEHIFGERVQLTGVTEYGMSWMDIISGDVQPPSEGVRFDISFEGRIFGDRLNGRVSGVDYLYIRGDGKFILELHASIITDDGEAIALHEDGILTPLKDGTGNLKLNMKFLTASSKYSWLNRKQVWGTGSVEFSKGLVTIDAYTN
jgi:hypothetical protein